MTTTPSTLKRQLAFDERVDGISNLLRAKGFKAWRSNVEAVHGCARPIRMVGKTSLHAGGVEVAAAAGPVWVACKNRRATVCEPCSERYAADTFHLVRAGLVGGKGVPETVTTHTRVFATLTPPSFGAVHNQPRNGNGRPRPCRCGEWHSDYDTRLGSPVDIASYDYPGAVLWQAHATELWRRFTITVVRHLAAALGRSVTELRALLRVSYTKVAEYQRRGLVHFHSVIRLDGPDGPDSAPGVTVDSGLLERVIRSAAKAVSVSSPDSMAVGVRELVWGDQVDVAPVAPHDPSDPAQLANDHSVAGYIAKYATKGTGASAGTDRPIRHERQIDNLPVSEHIKTMIATAWWLGGLDEFNDAEKGLRLRKWAHMLGFRGHFLTKSRRYSTTFTVMRRTRAEHRIAETLAAHGISDTEDVEVTGWWEMTGIGYRSGAEREFAEVIAQGLRERRRMAGANLIEEDWE